MYSKHICDQYKHEGTHTHPPTSGTSEGRDGVYFLEKQMSHLADVEEKNQGQLRSGCSLVQKYGIR